MRLYVTARGRWAGTQADANRIAKDEGTGWEQLDVPTDKEGLLGFLNAYQVDAMHDEAKSMIDGAPVAPPAAPPAPISAPAAVTLTDVEEFIQAADPARLASLASNVCYRMAELARGLN